MSVINASSKKSFGKGVEIKMRFGGRMEAAIINEA
jgi:hypothetical protein